MGRWLATLVAVAALLSLVILAAVAVADSPVPPPDTQYSPQPKPAGSQWSAVGGARFGGKGALQKGSPTPFTVDFLAVRFSGPRHGFAGGAACADQATAWDGLDGCERVPVLWEYTENQGWQEVYRGSSPGFVAAIAFIGHDRVLAVGGDTSPSAACPQTRAGCPGFPRREQPAADVTAGKPDPAGNARAWLWDRSVSDGHGWRELGKDELPAAPNAKPLTGLTALDCSAQREEFCVAGGLRQLAMWHDGQFTKVYSNESAEYPAPGGNDSRFKPVQDPRTEVVNHANWLFRVRAIRFAPPSQAWTPPTESVVAVTAGCCSSAASANSASVLNWDAYQPTYWSVASNSSPPPGEPDSYYALGPDGSSVIETPGGEPTSGPSGGSQPQPASVITQPGAGLGLPTNRLLAGYGVPDLVPDLVSGVRLLSGDGDVAAPPSGCLPARGCGPGDSPDGVMDWAVGVLSSSGQGVAYTTTVLAPAPSPLDCGPGGIYAPPSAQCKPAPDVKGQAGSNALFWLDSYALNGFAMASADTSLGWAVGDRGALMALNGGSGAADAGAPPPALGALSPGSLSDRGPYDAFRPPGVSGQPGVVPALSSQPLERLAAPFVSGASPEPTRSRKAPAEDVTAMVMSRDGTEGWAVGVDPTLGGADGGDDSSMTLFHFNGGSWVRCDMRGVAGVLPADPACASLSALPDYKGPAGTRVRFTAIARVPLENGSDPSKANDFEAIAVGTEYQLTPDDPARDVVARYRDGRWSLDTAMMQQLGGTSDYGTNGRPPALVYGATLEQIAFTSPTDGWLVGTGGGTGKLFHFDGTDWQKCGIDPVACGDRDGILPHDVQSVGNGFHLATVGRRVYLAATRLAVNPQAFIDRGVLLPANQLYPVIVYRDTDKACAQVGDAGCWRSDGGGLDPGCVSRDPATHACQASSTASDQGSVASVAVTLDRDGRYVGWATGHFGAPGVPGVQDQGSGQVGVLSLSGSDQRWSKWRVAGDAADDYLAGASGVGAPFTQQPPRAFAFPGMGGDPAALITETDEAPAQGTSIPVLSFDGARGRWGVLATPFLAGQLNSIGEINAAQHTLGLVRGVAPDGRGGFWMAVRQDTEYGGSGTQAVYFYHYTDRAPRAVFGDVSHPVREPVSAAAGGRDGSFWVATRSGVVYRYDRAAGWDRVSVPGWDPGRVVTSASPAYAIAVGADGSGVLVGKAGRIADLSAGSVVLDALAGQATTRDLHAVAVAPDGSVIAGGDHRALVWRPPGGAFASISPPDTAVSAQITGVSLPTGGRAWLTTNLGQVFAGHLNGGAWSWTLENADVAGDLLSARDPDDLKPEALRAVAVDASGHGFAVGDRGVILERSGDGPQPWRRVASERLDNLTSVALPAGGSGAGALIGGYNGLVLTLVNGRFEVARQADGYDPFNGPGGNLFDEDRVVGVALTPGYKAGQVEAWAADQVPPGARRGDPPPTRILHYTSDPAETLLSPERRVHPLPDAPAARPGELSFAALGKSECRLGVGACPQLLGSNLANEVLARRIGDELLARGQHGLGFSLFTGDVNIPDPAGKGRVGQLARLPERLPDQRLLASGFHRWQETFAGRLIGGGLPLFGAVGAEDLLYAGACGEPYNGPPCVDNGQTSSGSNVGWREGLAGMAAPWGRVDKPVGNGSLSLCRFRFRRAPAS